MVPCGQHKFTHLPIPVGVPSLHLSSNQPMGAPAEPWHCSQTCQPGVTTLASPQLLHSPAPTPSAVMTYMHTPTPVREISQAMCFQSRYCNPAGSACSSVGSCLKQEVIYCQVPFAYLTSLIFKWWICECDT